MKNRFDRINADFKCVHCNHYVSTDTFLSGVVNRNHCPYCLHSRHLDLYKAGDRLSACKAEMRPVGLTLKKTNKKYGKNQGELMIIHRCVDCGDFSINRIAADDIASTIYEIFEKSLRLDKHTIEQMAACGIVPLNADDEEIVHARLFGWADRSLSYSAAN